MICDEGDEPYLRVLDVIERDPDLIRTGAAPRWKWW
jgi:hypothetical protein